MLLRVVTLVTTFLLVSVLVSSLLAPRDAVVGRGAGVLGDVRPRPAAGERSGVVRAALPAERPVEAEVGDVVELTIASASPDVAQLPELGFEVAVGPGIPGTVQLVADRAGRFDVRLSLAGRRVGTLLVRPRAGT